MTGKQKKYIRHDGIQRYIADSERVLKTVFLAAFHGRELIAVAGQLAEDTNILHLYLCRQQSGRHGD